MINEEYINLPNLLKGKDSNLKILYNQGVLALQKPAGVLIDAYPWYPDAPSIIYQLKQELAQGKLTEYHLQNIYSIYSLEPEVTGVALIATDKQSSNDLRNQFGSDQILFRFILLSKSDLNADSLVCELPIAKHYRENRVLVSSKTGKKSKTLFSLIAKQGKYQLWEAQTTYLRMHQIRLHAMECGINILGETLYKADSTDISETEGIFLHLSSVEWGDSDSRIKVRSPLPTPMNEFLSKKIPMSPGLFQSIDGLSI